MLSKPARKYDINPESIIFRVYELNVESYGNFLSVRAKDLISSTTKFNYIETDTLELKFKNKETFDILFSKLKQTTLLFERVIYSTLTDDILANSDYNPIFFANFTSFSQEQTQGVQKQEIGLKGFDFKGFYEDKKTVEHTKFYALPLPAEQPDNFNKVVYNDNFENIMINIYQRNIGYPDSELVGLPVERIKGLQPQNEDIDRKIKGFDSLAINNANFINYNVVTGKKSILAFKKDYYNYSQSNNVFEVYKVQAKLINNKVKVVYNASNQITLQNPAVKDIPISSSITQKEEAYSNNVLVESSEYDTLFEEVTNLGANDSTKFELTDNSSPNEGNISNFTEYGQGKLEEVKKVEERSFEIEFKEYEFIKDIYAGDELVLIGFDEFDGTYLIKSLTEVIEGEYVTYSIDEMEKVN